MSAAAEHWFYKPIGKAKRASGGGAPAPTTVSVAGPGESIEVYIRPGDESRIEALGPWMQYGPDYIRGVAEGIRDYSTFVKRGELESAERYLSDVESLVEKRLSRRKS